MTSLRPCCRSKPWWLKGERKRLWGARASELTHDRCGAMEKERVLLTCAPPSSFFAKRPSRSDPQPRWTLESLGLGNVLRPQPLPGPVKSGSLGVRSGVSVFKAPWPIVLCGQCAGPGDSPPWKQRARRLIPGTDPLTTSHAGSPVS